MNGKENNPRPHSSVVRAMEEALQKCKDDEIFKVMVDDKTTKAFALQRVCEVVVNHFEEKWTQDSEANSDKLSKIAQENHLLQGTIDELKQKNALEIIGLQGKLSQTQQSLLSANSSKKQVEEMLSQSKAKHQLELKNKEQAFQDERRKILAEVSQLQEITDELKQQLKERDSKCEVSMEECRSLKNRLKESSQDIVSAKTKLDRLEADLARLSADNTKLHSANSQLVQDYDSLLKYSKEKEAEIRSLKDAADASEKSARENAQRHAGEFDALKRDAQEAHKKLEAQTSLMRDQHKSKVARLKEELSELRADNERLARDVLASQTRLQSNSSEQSKQAAALEDSIKSVKSMYESKLHELTSAHTAALEAAKSLHLKESARIKSEAEESMDRKCKQIREDCEERAKRLESELAKTKSDAEERIRWFKDNSVKKEVFEAALREKEELSTQLHTILEKQESVLKQSFESARPPISQEVSQSIQIAQLTASSLSLKAQREEDSRRIAELQLEVDKLEDRKKKMLEDLRRAVLEKEAERVKLDEVSNELQREKERRKKDRELTDKAGVSAESSQKLLERLRSDLEQTSKELSDSRKKHEAELAENERLLKAVKLLKEETAGLDSSKQRIQKQLEDTQQSLAAREKEIEVVSRQPSR